MYVTKYVVLFYKVPPIIERICKQKLNPPQPLITLFCFCFMMHGRFFQRSSINQLGFFWKVKREISISHRLEIAARLKPFEVTECRGRGTEYVISDLISQLTLLHKLLLFYYVSSMFNQRYLTFKTIIERSSLYKLVMMLMPFWCQGGSGSWIVSS